MTPLFYFSIFFWFVITKLADSFAPKKEPQMKSSIISALLLLVLIFLLVQHNSMEPVLRFPILFILTGS